MEFIEYFLLFLAVSLATLYIYQHSYHTSETQLANSKTSENRVNRANNGFVSSSVGELAMTSCDRVSTPVNNKCRLAGNQGPALGFHQSFKTSLPELGWRNYYVRNYGGLGSSQTVKDTGISGSLTENYLSGLKSVDNIYKYTNY